MNFLDIRTRTEFAFKKVFGSEDSKDILLSFLNALIEFDGGRKITDLAIINAHQAGLPVDIIAQIVQLAVTDVEAVFARAN